MFTRHVRGRRSTQRPKAQLPPRRTAVVAQVYSRNGGHFDLSWAIPTRRTNRCYFFTAAAVLALSQVTLHLGIAGIPIPKTRYGAGRRWKRQRRQPAGRGPRRKDKHSGLELPCLMLDHVAKLCSAGSHYFVPVPVPVLSGLLPPPRRVSRRS